MTDLDDLLASARPDPDGPTTAVTARHRAQLDQLIDQRRSQPARSTPAPLVSDGGRATTSGRARGVYLTALAVGLVVIGLSAATLIVRSEPSITPGQGREIQTGDIHAGWYVPANLAPGWRLDLAYRQHDVSYLGLRDGSGNTVRILTGTSDHFGESWASVELAGITDGHGWVQGDPGTSVRILADGQVQVFETFHYRELPASLRADIDSMRSLVLVGDEGLSIDPIDVEAGPYLPVATALFDGQAHTFGIAGPSGRFAATSIYAGTAPATEGLASARGCCRTLDTQGNAVRFVEVWTSESGGGALVAGFLEPEVARADLHLADGTFVAALPETRDHGLPVNFFLITLPPSATPAEAQASLDHVERVVAYDMDGNEIEQLTDIHVN